MRLIRCLWGGRIEGGVWDRLISQDIPRTLGGDRVMEPLVYVCGQENDAILRAWGFRTRLIFSDPWPHGHDRWDEGLRTMVRPWKTKLELLRHAADEHGRVIYCDWDVLCRMPKEDIPRVSELLSHDLEGSPRSFALSAFLYRMPRRRSWRRGPLRRSERDRRITPSGNWIYSEGCGLFLETMRIMGEAKPWEYERWHDEYALDELVERECGGWPGRARWITRYESPVMVQRGRRGPFRRMMDYLPLFLHA